nr:PREDICTED: putative 2-oxo-4-hydroxy-4-carboxy-5-ureidoimidazoline decarboxylase [Bos mutus]
MDIEKVNSMDFGEFVDVFGNVIERCPLIAAAVWSKRPFSGLGDLEKHFFAFIDGLPLSGQCSEMRRSCLPRKGCSPRIVLRSTVGEGKRICHLRLADLLGEQPERPRQQRTPGRTSGRTRAAGARDALGTKSTPAHGGRGESRQSHE